MLNSIKLFAVVIVAIVFNVACSKSPEPAAQSVVNNVDISDYKRQMQNIFVLWNAEIQDINNKTPETIGPVIDNLNRLADEFEAIDAPRCLGVPKEKIKLSMLYLRYGLVMYKNGERKLQPELKHDLNKSTRFNDEDDTDYAIRVSIANELNKIEGEPPELHTKVLAMASVRQWGDGINKFDSCK